MKSLYLLYIILLTNIVSSSTFAGEITVTNDNCYTIWFRFIPQKDHLRSQPQMIEMAPHSNLKINVTADLIDHKPIYSIEGDKKIGGSNGPCLNLQLSKNYQVTFKQDKFSFKCVSHEIK